MRKTKIVCTLGPATDRDGILKSLIVRGLDVARLNFSHGSQAEHLERLHAVRSISEEVGRFVGVLADISGPKIRLGTMAEEISVSRGQKLRVVEAAHSDDRNTLPIQVPGIIPLLRVGSKFSVADGLVVFEVCELHDDAVDAVVVVPGRISSRKGVSLPGIKINLPTITDKDRDDIAFATKHGADFLAISFVRHEDDVRLARQIAKSVNSQHEPRIISKIETPFALERILEIATESDGIMVARGDLGVEIASEEVPIEQKRLIHLCNSLGKPVITATQMLESMVHSPIPTRAESTDVATAIFDGTDAVMLSAETAAGDYPLEAFDVLDRVAVRTEREFHNQELTQVVRPAPQRITVADSIGYCASVLSQTLPIKAIVATTKSGHSARVIAKFRPRVDVVGATPFPHVARSLSLSFGVSPALVSESLDTDRVLSEGIDAATRIGMVNDGDLVVIVLGLPFGVGGTTNLLKVQLVGGGLLS